MAKRKKAGLGEGLIALVIGAFALFAMVPKEVWIGGAVIAAILAVAYAVKKAKKSAPEKSEAQNHLAKPPPGPARASGRKSQVVRSNTVVDEAPVQMAKTREAPSQGFAIPASPKTYGAGQWVPAGQSVTIAGISISGGMIYVGTSLPTPHGVNDPCLIDPSKSVAKSGDYKVRQMDYWPSYSEVSSTARRSYLNWLANGRKDPEADIGFVFLFFYGLERRAIIDAPHSEEAQADWPLIAQELRRLLAVYGQKSGSFRRYAGELLNWVALFEHPKRLYEQPVPTFPKTFELPLYIRLALGQAAVDAQPVPTHLALAWARQEPSISLRTPATRCPDQFEQLFAQKYAEMCGQGMVLPHNRTKLKLVYQPASSGFRGSNEHKLTFKDTPDVTVLTGPVRKLQEVVDAATKPLESYSRLVGKSTEARSSLEALLQLPASLWPAATQLSVEKLKERMGEGMVAMNFQDLLANLGAKGTFTKQQTASLARALESINVGFEPDVLSGSKSPSPDERVVLFYLPASETISRANGPYLAAALTLQLASAVASADGEFGIKEMGHLRKAVLTWHHLTPSQTRRLLAHLRLLMQAPASLTALKKKFEPLDVGVKETVAAFMATVAQSDGEVTPAEVKMLEKVYKALGLDAKKVFADVHAVASESPAAPAPASAAVARPKETGFKLDPARIAALQRDTEKVSALLANIFTDAEEPANSSMLTPREVPMDAESPGGEDDEEAKIGLLGLDEAHSALARMMLSRPQWSREELLDIAADLDLMLDGALEHINEAAFDAHDMPLFEGDEPVVVNAEIMEKVEA